MTELILKLQATSTLEAQAKKALQYNFNPICKCTLTKKIFFFAFVAFYRLK
jgi:hypothetical protein